MGYVTIVKVMNLARIVLVGFAQTLTLMTAQLLAAKTYSAVKAVYRYCSNVSLIYWLVSSALSVIFCQLLAGMFFDPQAKTRQLTPSSEFTSMLLLVSSFSPSSSSLMKDCSEAWF